MNVIWMDWSLVQRTYWGFPVNRKEGEASPASPSPSLPSRSAPAVALLLDYMPSQDPTRYTSNGVSTSSFTMFFTRVAAEDCLML